MASGDSTAIPIKEQAYRVTFPILDADGDLVTGAAGLDSEISKDGGTFADVTAEATEIATASGMYYLDLTSGEMNADTVALIVKTTTTGAKTTPIVLYPAESTDIPVNLTAIGGVVQSLTDFKDFVDNGYDPDNNKVQSDLIYIHGTALTETDGQLAAAFKKLFDVATPLLVASDVMVGTDAAALATTALTNATWTDAKAVHLDADISGRAPSGEYDTQMGYVPSNLGDVATATELNNAHGAGSWATATSVTVSDKTGFSLSTAGIKAVWDQLTNALTTVGSVGKLLVDNINATISSRNATTPPTVGEIRTEMEGVGTKLADVLDDVTGLDGDVMRGTDLSALASDAAVNSVLAASIITVVNQTTFGLNAGSSSFNAYNQMSVVIYDNSNYNEASVRKVVDWDLISKVMYIDSAPDFTAVIGDTVKIFESFDMSTLALATTALSDATWTDAKAGYLDAAITSRNAITPNTVVPDAAGTAATLHGITDGKVDNVQTDATGIKDKTDNLPSGMAKNVAVPKFEVFMVLSLDHITAATGKTVTGIISKDGGSFAALANSITEVSNGTYILADGLTQDERNADVSTLIFTADDCDDLVITIISS